MLGKVYPVGSIYMSLSATNPGTLFGGTWAQITGRFLLAAGNGNSAGATGGEATHKLTVAEMPSHTHTWSIGESTLWCAHGDNRWGPADVTTYNTGSTGGNTAHNNMPPYYAVYMWRRTA